MACSEKKPGQPEVVVKIPVRSKYVKVISSVPMYDKGSEIASFSGAFPSQCVNREKGYVSLRATRDPVYVVDGDISLKEKILSEESPFGFHPANIPGCPNPFEAAQDIGIRWHRGFYAYWIVIQKNKENIERGSFSWTENDREWGSVPRGMSILANIGLPERRKMGHDTAVKNMPGLKKYSWELNESEESYIMFVRTVVDRYDKDGKNDMPGLSDPIKYWQFENEPDLGGNKDWEGFAHLQEITYKAIKEEFPQAKVLMGGQSGDGIGIFDRFYAPILKKLKGRFIDVYDLHYYGDARLDWFSVKKEYEHIRKTLDSLGYENTEIWITETGTYSGKPGDEKGGLLPVNAPSGIKDALQTEHEQARDVVKRYVFSLSLGVKKIFWAFGLMEGFKHDDGFFDHTGFIYDGEFDRDPPRGTKKLAYYTYKLMTETLDGADWSKAQSFSLCKDVYAINVKRGKGSVTILWYDPPYSASDILSNEKMTEINRMLESISEKGAAHPVNWIETERRFDVLVKIV